MRRWRDPSVRLGLLDEAEAFMARGKATGAILSEEEDRWAAQSMLDYWSTVLFREHRDAGDATLEDFDPSFSPELDDSQCPYVGLASFGERSSTVFFGRERLSSSIIEALGKTRLLFVLGASGSGKSSVVRAGVLPKLKAGDDKWVFVPAFVPGSQPLLNLARALKPKDSAIDWTREEAESLEGDPQQILKLLPADQPAILCVDQFEETFTLAPEGAARDAFLECLRLIATGAGPRHTVIVTMRSDFEGQLLRVPSLAPYFEDAVRVPPLNAAELREAIEKPAALIGLKFEAGLVDELVSQILGEPAGLPLLQFTLLELWQRRDRNRVTWADYRSLGGARNALGSCADRFYNGLLREDQQTVKRILLRMVRPGPGHETTSSRVPKESLFDLEARDRVERVLSRLVEARLLKVSPGETPADDQVEVAHEALVRNWPTLVNWLEDERRNIEKRRWLTDRVDRWQRLKEETEGLLRGTDLTEAQQLDAADLTASERRYIALSVQAAQEEERAKERSALALATTNRLLRTVAVALAVSLLLAMYQYRRATRSQSGAEVRMLTSVAERLTNLNNYELAALLARQAYLRDRDMGGPAVHEVDAAMRNVLSLPYFGRSLHEHSGADVLAYCPAGSFLAEGVGNNLEVSLFRGRQHQKLFDSVSIGDIRALAFDAGCTRLAAGTAQGNTFIWDLKNASQNPVKLGGMRDAVTCLAVSETAVAACQEDTSVRYWRRFEGEPAVLPTIKDAAGKVTALAFDATGGNLAAGLSEGSIALWSDPGGRAAFERQRLPAPVQALVFGEDKDSGLLVAISSREVFRMRMAGPPAVFRGPVESVGKIPAVGNNVGNSVAVSADGLKVAVGDSVGRVNLWMLDQAGTAPVSLPGAEESVIFTIFHPDGRLYSGSASFSLREWLPRSEPRQLSPRGSDQGAAFNVGGEILGLIDGNAVRLMATGPWDELWSTAAHPQALFAVAVCDLRDRLATTSLDGQVRVWRASNPREPAMVSSSRQNSPISMDAKGQLMAFVGADNNIEIWDIDSKRRKEVLAASAVGVLAMRPDGKGVAWTGNDGKQVQVRDFAQRANKVLWNFDNPVTGLAYSGDSSLLAAATERQVMLAANEKPLGEMPGLEPNQKIQGVVLSADGDNIAVSVDNVMLVWAARKPSQLPIVMRGHGSYIRAMAFRRQPSVTSGLLLSTGNERTLVWSSTGALAEQVCAKTRGRPLSDKEWLRWVGAGVSQGPQCEQ